MYKRQPRHPHASKVASQLELAKDALKSYNTSRRNTLTLNSVPKNVLQISVYTIVYNRFLKEANCPKDKVLWQQNWKRWGRNFKGSMSGWYLIPSITISLPLLLSLRIITTSNLRTTFIISSNRLVLHHFRSYFTLIRGFLSVRMNRNRHLQTRGDVRGRVYKTTDRAWLSIDILYQHK